MRRDYRKDLRRLREAAQAVRVRQVNPHRFRPHVLLPGLVQLRDAEGSPDPESRTRCWTQLFPITVFQKGLTDGRAPARNPDRAAKDSAKALGDVPVMAPPATELRRLADLIETAAVSRAAAFEAVRVRHDVLRDAIIAAIAAPATGRN